MRNQPNPLLIPVRRFVPLVLLLGLYGCSGGGGGGIAFPPVNQTPVASNSCTYVSGVNQPLNGNLIATDPEGQPLSYSIVSDPSWGGLSVNPLDGTFTYTPIPNTRGSDTFTFQACEPAPSTICSSPATYKIVHTPRIMPLGDSITEGVEDGTNGPCSTSPCPALTNRISYRKDLRDALVAAGYTIDFVGTQTSGASLLSDDQHEGHGGWTADQLVNGNSNPTAGTGSNATEGGYLSNWLNGKMDTATGADPANAGWPDVILLHIGTNDLSPSGDQSSQWTDVQLIRTAIVNWSSANSWPVTVIYSRIDNTNPASGEFTTFNNNVITSLNPSIWVNHEAALLNIPAFYGDDVHPNASGYQAMANVWLHPLAGIGTSSGNYAGSGILEKCP